jgi:hypothetical protein
MSAQPVFSTANIIALLSWIMLAVCLDGLGWEPR